MSNDLTTSNSINPAGLQGLVKTAYDRYVEFALRSVPLFRTAPSAIRRPVQQAMPGSSVVFSLYTDLAPATTPLTEGVDVDSENVPDVTTISVTLNEYGNVVTYTKKLGELAFTDVDPGIANIVAYNMANSLDRIVSAVLNNGSNVSYGGNATSVNTVDAQDIISVEDVRVAVTALRSASAVPTQSDLYSMYLHPRVAADLRRETGTAGAFTDIRKYTENSVGNILQGTIGVLEGTVAVETPRAPFALNTAQTPVNVYTTFIMGQQALAEAVAVEPGTVIGPVVDRLMRNRPIGWYGLLGHSIYRQNALQVIKSAATNG